MKELLHQEVVIIDREEYVKVPNPRASEGRDQPKYLYIPVDEYLSKREAFTNPTIRREETKQELSVQAQPLPPVSDKEISEETFSSSTPTMTRSDLKKKVLMGHFDDRTTNADEVFGDWVAEKLTREVSRRSGQILFIDYSIVAEFLEKMGIVSSDLEKPKTLRLLNEALGIHALVVGQLSGPYVFSTKAAKEKDETASAIVKIETKIVDTLSGNTLKDLSVCNPIVASKEKGVFSEEKAKIKAIDLAISGISKDLSRELNQLDWFCRIAKVDGEKIYINAGKLTGLRVGDIIEVLGSGGLGEKPKGKVQILAFLGIDASVARLIDGKNPEVSDILKLAAGKGT